MSKHQKTGLIVFGRLAQKSPRAAWLSPADAAIADWLATHLGLTTLRVTPEIMKTVEVPVTEWQLDANGQPVLPIIPTSAFDRLQSLSRQAAAGDPIGITEVGAPVADEVPEPDLSQAGKLLWDAIRVRGLVLAQESDPADGWWEAIVLAARNGQLTLCWRDYPEQGLFRRRRDQVALLRPAC